MGKNKYHEPCDAIYKRIKYIFYNNNKVVGYSIIGILISNHTVHK